MHYAGTVLPCSSLLPAAVTSKFTNSNGDLKRTPKPNMTVHLYFPIFLFASLSFLEIQQAEPEPKPRTAMRCGSGIRGICELQRPNPKIKLAGCWFLQIQIS
jgi:hypothetical protein